MTIIDDIKTQLDNLLALISNNKKHGDLEEADGIHEPKGVKDAPDGYHAIAQSKKVDWVASTSTDEKVKVSAGDQTTGFLGAKLVNAGNVTFTILNPGTDEAIKADVASAIDKTVTYYTVTTEFPANQVINLLTGNGTTGVSTKDGVDPLLPASDALFKSNGFVEVIRGIEQYKGAGNQVVWDSTTSFHFTTLVSVGEVIIVKGLTSY